jgi:hypothetical protein
MSIETTAAIIGALVGAISGGLVSFVIFFLQERIRAQRISDGLQFTISPGRGLSVGGRVKNNSPYPIRNCWAYITLQYEDDDIVNAGETFIHREEPHQLVEDRLCWSIAGNPPTMDICPGESQALNIALFARNAHMFFIVSEKNDKPYRVCLRGNKEYRGWIKIVNFESKAKCYPIVINAQNEINPILIR